MRSDADLLFAIETLLERDMETSVLDIGVKVEDGVAYLDGVVDVLGDKSFAEKCIREVPGIKDVVNRLTIGLERRVKDKDIEVAVEESMYKKNENLRKIGVAAKKGVVHLYGRVANLAEEKEVMSAAAEVQGVKEVVNHMNIQGDKDGTPIDDATIHNNIRVLLSTDYDVDRGDIEVSVKDGCTILDGEVEDLEAVEMAGKLAARASGVHKVINNLHSREGGLGEDEALAVEIMHEMGKDDRINPGQLNVFVEDGTVYLGGSVYSPEARRAAVDLTSKLVRKWKNIKGIQVGITVDGSNGSVQKQRDSEIIH